MLYMCIMRKHLSSSLLLLLSTSVATRLLFFRVGLTLSYARSAFLSVSYLLKLIVCQADLSYHVQDAEVHGTELQME